MLHHTVTLETAAAHGQYLFADNGVRSRCFSSCKPAQLGLPGEAYGRSSGCHLEWNVPSISQNLLLKLLWRIWVPAMVC